jgi:hypothetical protein
MAVFLYAPIMLQCMSPLVMLCTAPSPARECQENGCCLLQRMSPSLALNDKPTAPGFVAYWGVTTDKGRSRR